MDENIHNESIENNYYIVTDQEHKYAAVIEGLREIVKNPNDENEEVHLTSDLNFDEYRDYEDKIKEANESIIKNANHWFLVNTISPEIKKNEEKKRGHKKILLIFVVIFLVVQFAFLGYLIYWIFDNIFSFYKNNIVINDSTIKIIFAFVSGYITSVVVELIAMLKYIVKNVFDTSVSGLANAFKEDNNESDIKEQKE